MLMHRGNAYAIVLATESRAMAAGAVPRHVTPARACTLDLPVFRSFRKIAELSG
jgi:hypothetical protein